MGKTLGSALFSVHMCSPLWTLIGAAALLPIIQLRTLNSTTVLCVINMISIMVAIALVIAGLVTQGRGPEVKSPIVAEDLTFLGFMQSLSAIFFAFGGQFMFYELMSEMKEFTDFPKSESPFLPPLTSRILPLTPFFRPASCSIPKPSPLLARSKSPYTSWLGWWGTTTRAPKRPGTFWTTLGLASCTAWPLRCFAFT